eukprot:SAG11_NODE_895_length_6641_cov_6.653928_2_plen_193_part_00
MQCLPLQDLGPGLLVHSIVDRLEFGARSPTHVCQRSSPPRIKFRARGAEEPYDDGAHLLLFWVEPFAFHSVVEHLGRGVNPAIKYKHSISTRLLFRYKRDRPGSRGFCSGGPALISVSLVIWRKFAFRYVRNLPLRIEGHPLPRRLHTITQPEIRESRAHRSIRGGGKEGGGGSGLRLSPPANIKFVRSILP